MVSKTNKQESEFRLPDLGEGLEEADLIEWCVHPGQRVKEDDILAKMETAKALVDVPSPRAGVIAALHGAPGQTIKVGAALVTYLDGSAEPAEVPAAPVSAEQHLEPPVDRPDAGSVVGSLGESDNPAPAAGKALATPAVRRLARDRGVDIDQVAGTGIGGRVTALDVEAASSRAKASSARHSGANGSRHRPSPKAAEPAPPAARTPFRGVRKAIADHLRYSVTHAVHYTVMDEADVTALDHLRRKLVAASNEKISLLPFVAFAVCRVLTGSKPFARINSTVDDETEEIVQHRSVHLGVATDTEAGLMVPVIRNAHRLGTLEISRHIAKLARGARERSLSPEQLSGSTFTISNFGSVGGRFGTPIINYPEAAILAVGRAREGVVVRNGMLGVGKLLPLSMSADHRVIDGATAATALARIIELLQSPEQLMPTGLEEPE